jgi:chitinase
MMDGHTPTGQTLTACVASFTGALGSTYIFNTSGHPLPSPPLLTAVRGWADNVNGAFTGLLGRTANAGLNNASILRLQVCDADFNLIRNRS